MRAAVVDENVPIVANDVKRVLNGAPAIAAHAGDGCRLATVRYLRELIADGVIVIDDGGQCLRRYRHYLSGAGQPGTGDAFLKHVFDNAYNSSRVERVPLSLRPDGSFEGFPQQSGLGSFDDDDRLFIAIALTSELTPTIVNAVDSDYRIHNSALLSVGVHVT
jgi:hypothetical protein